MRPSEEWANEIARLECLTDADVVLIEVKAIQLDAFKAGMEYAAKILKQYKTMNVAASYNCSHIILTAAQNPKQCMREMKT